MATTYQPIDNEDAFRAWLREYHQHKDRLVQDTIARCRRINHDLGNIREAYDADKCAKLLKQLTYTAEDAHNRRLPPGGLLFTGDTKSARYYEKTLFEGLRCLHNALKVYCEFRSGEHEKRGVVPNQPKPPKKWGARKMMPSDFETFLKNYHKWLVNEADLTKGSADCYKTYVRKLRTAVDKEFGEGWFEALLSARDATFDQGFITCSAFIEKCYRVSAKKDKKSWNDWRSAFYQIENYLDSSIDWEAIVKTVLKRPEPPTISVALRQGAASKVFTKEDRRKDKHIHAKTLTHDQLCGIFRSRINSQGRYYPAHKLLFPTRLLNKIFKCTKLNAWQEWMNDDFENMRVLTSKTGEAISFSEVKEMHINMDGMVSILKNNGEQCELYTRKFRDGAESIEIQKVRSGLCDISIDHVISLENMIGIKKGVLKGLERITQCFRQYEKDRGVRLNPRAERTWVEGFFNCYRKQLDSDEMRSLLIKDLEHLDFRYELMDLRENSKKGKAR